jgi:diguanylate cyclase (GGDEF)-like protein/PAS domain S-box-containing protein
VKQLRLHIFVACALAVVLLGAPTHSLRHVLNDWRFRATERQATGDVVVVAIDPKSIARIGVWPWRRSLHAQLLAKLQSAGVSEIAFDVDFSTPSDPGEDNALAKALAEAGGSVILPAFGQSVRDAAGNPSLFANRPIPLLANRSWSALVNVEVEADGLVRRYPFGEICSGRFEPAMAAMLAGRYEQDLPPFLIDFGIRETSIPVLSYVDVLNGDPAVLGLLKDKKVIVGGTALELGDRFSVPNGRVVSGPVLQALAAESILQNRALRTNSQWLTLLGLLGIGALATLLLRHCSMGRAAAILAATAFAIELSALVLQQNLALILNTLPFHTVITAYLLAIALQEIDLRGLLTRAAERRFRNIAMAIGDGLVCVDMAGQITVWNPAAANIFGYSSDDAIGRSFDDLLARRSRSSLARDIAALTGKTVELQGRRNNGEIFPLEACFSTWSGAEGTQVGVVLRDISERKREAERIKYLAEHDTLTDLANRDALRAHLAKCLSRADHAIGILTLSIDNFERLNAMLGNDSGDALLRAFADRLRAIEGDSWFAARLDGSEFALAVDDADAPSIATLSERLFAAFGAEPLAAGTGSHHVRISIGAAIASEGCHSADQLLGDSLLALHRAKSTSQSNRGHVLFTQSIRDEIEARAALELELVGALANDEFELFYQPQVRLTDQIVVGAEALIRWRHPRRGLIPPGQFMPVANASSIANRLAEWVLRTACQQARRWEHAGFPLRIAVNLSPSQFEVGDLASSVDRALRDSNLKSDLLELEVTENIFLDGSANVLNMLDRIRSLGVRIAFDDFGTGYASLTYLKKFPIDGLKIDRSFVVGLVRDADDAAIVESTISLSKKLKLGVIAEGIEDGATAALLLALGCEEGQGYYFGKPMPANEFTTTFLTGEPRHRDRQITAA